MTTKLGTGFGRELGIVLDLATPVLRNASAAVWRPEGLRARYAEYLATMHATIRASVPLMELAARRCGPADESLGAYFATHIEEERHHDAWLVQDMVAAGLDADALVGRQPAPEVARLVGPQYYWINHHDPACLLGYITVLEGNAPSPLLTPMLMAATGLGEPAFRTLHFHAVADAEHRDDLELFLNTLDPNPARRAAIRVSALHTVVALADLFAAIAAH